MLESIQLDRRYFLTSKPELPEGVFEKSSVTRFSRVEIKRMYVVHSGSQVVTQWCNSRLNAGFGLGIKLSLLNMFGSQLNATYTRKNMGQRLVPKETVHLGREPFSQWVVRLIQCQCMASFNLAHLGHR
jgi:hypothetical protein